MTAITLQTIGVHDGLARDIARACATCRPTPTAWTTLPLDLDHAAHHVHNWARRHPQPEADAVTWVAGHDGTPGPGYAFAELVADSWQLPLVEALQRTTPVASVHRSPRRATLDEQVASLHACPTTQRLIVVDNTATSGTSLHAAIDRLHAERVVVAAVVTASISRHLTAEPGPTRRGDPM